MARSATILFVLTILINYLDSKVYSNSREFKPEIRMFANKFNCKHEKQLC